MSDYKHYVRTDANSVVIQGFSSAFEAPEPADICINENAGRHFTLQLTSDRGQYRYKLVNGALAERSQSELDADWSERPPAPPTADQRLSDLEMALADIFANGGV